MRISLFCMALLGAGLPASLPALPGAAATARFVPPAGCTLEMTVQLRGCRVENHYRCPDDPAGDRRISFSDRDGEYYLNRIDSETRWVASVETREGLAETLDAEASADNASFSTLLATGRDDYDFVTRANTGETRHYIGHDRLTGATLSVGKVPLERTEFSMRIEDGTGQLLATRQGEQLISRDLRLFFPDRESFAASDGETSDDVGTPVLFAFPGDAGFAAAEPMFDCDTMVSQLTAPLQLTGGRP